MESYSLITVIEGVFFVCLFDFLLRQSFCVATAVLELGVSIRLKGLYHHTHPANFNLKEIEHKVIILAQNCKSNFYHFYMTGTCHEVLKPCFTELERLDLNGAA